MRNEAEWTEGRVGLTALYELNLPLQAGRHRNVAGRGPCQPHGA